MSHREAPLAEFAAAVLNLAGFLKDIGETITASHGLTPAETAVLRWIYIEPGSSAQRTARAVGMQPSNISPLIRSLVDADLLRREVDPADARRSALHLTAKAQRLEAEIRHRWVAKLREANFAVDAVTLNRVTEVLHGFEMPLRPTE